MSGASSGPFPLDAALRGLRERHADAVIDAERSSLREHVVVVPAARLREIAVAITREWGGELIQLFGLDERALHGRFRLHAMFSMAPQDAVLTLVAAVPEDAPHYPSLARELPAAAWLERELADMLGVLPDDHPDPRPLVLHDGWPAGAHPLRRDFAAPAGLDWAPRFRVPEVPGEGVFEIPVGPIHAGIIEPGHFRFASGGESILALDVKLGWTWRGLEKHAEGTHLGAALETAERLCGTCALSHGIAFCQAVEEACGVQPPPRARALRTLCAELERIYNHCGDLGGILNDVAYGVGAMRAWQYKETVQQAIDALFGHRFLRGICVPGGVSRDLDDTQQLWLRRVLADVRGGVETLARLARSQPAVADRLVGTGRLTAGSARALAATGVVLRATGIARDTRRDHPYAFYREVDFQVPTRGTGDVMARFDQRVDEIHESLNIVDQLILRLPGGPLVQGVGEPPAGRWGMGLVESPRGRHVHWLRFDALGDIGDWRVRSASHANWPALPAALVDDIVPDFPLINKSFGLCYACCDK